MFTPASSHAANAYSRVSVQTSVDGADPHQLVVLLFDALEQALRAAKVSMLAKDIPAKCHQIGRAIRIVEEGLKAPLDLDKGGSVAANLDALYEYCVNRLVFANAHNDVALLDEVSSLLQPVIDGWKKIDGNPPSNRRSVQ